MPAPHHSSSSLRRHRPSANASTTPPGDSIATVARVLSSLQSGADPIPVAYQPGIVTPSLKEVLVGMGVSEPPADAAGICLNANTARITSARPIKSNSHLVIEAPKVWVDRWREILSDSGTESVTPRAVNEAFSGIRRIMVEDASPDSALAFVLLGARLAGIHSDGVEEWIEHVTNWELGDVHTVGEAHRSFAVLASALSHQYYNSEDIRDYRQTRNQGAVPMPSRSGKEVAPALFGAVALAWTEVTGFLTEALSGGHAPNALPRQPIGKHHARAIAALHSEEAIYNQLVRTGTRTQLLLPSKATGRLQMVDAFIGREHVVTGTSKVRLRLDREHTWFGNGFAFMAIHRPELTGTGNDITVTLDPEFAVSHRKCRFE